MHALVYDLSSSGQLRICAPFPLVSEAATVAVPSPEIQHVAVNPRPGFAYGTGNPGMEPVIEAHLDQSIAGDRCLCDSVHLSDAYTDWLFYENMCPSLESGAGD